MRRRLRGAVHASSFALVSGLCTPQPGMATPPLNAAPGVHGPEVMLYFSQPIGPSSSSRRFGLRIDQHSLPALLPAPTTNPADLSGRRQLLNLSMAAHQSLRLELGRRLSWDLSSRRLATAP